MTTKPSSVGAKPGSRQRRQRPQSAKPKKGLRPTLAAVAPLFDTYGGEKPKAAYFDEAAAVHAVDWIESNLRHFKGKWAGQPFYLLPWQEKLVRELFGWKRPDGTRLYRRAYIEAPRKTGKTSLAAAIALYLAYADNEAGPEVFFAAYDTDQAQLCYNTARHMLEANEGLFNQTLIYNSRKEMLLKDNPGGILKCLSSDYKKQFGLNLHGLVFDELMTQQTRDMWTALTTSQGSREQPLIFCISSAGWDRESICFEQHELTRQIAEGVIEDESFLGVIYGAPMDADWTDEEVWKQANPSLGETTDISFYVQKATQAQNQPTEQNAFRTLFLSQWVGQAQRFLDMEAWDGCGDEVAPLTGNGPLGFGGLDLSATTDMTAFLVIAERDGKLDIHPWIFLPEAGLHERERRDRAPYSTWAREGFLTLTPGAVVDYAYVRKAILDAAGAFDLKDVEHDRWNSSQLVKELLDEGVEMLPIGQGYASLSYPTKELSRLLLEGKFRHGGHPVLRWCANALAVTFDAAGNVKPDKSRSAHRIDPIQALIMALDGWMRRGRDKKPASVYESRPLLSV